jgi:glycosyltransferase involved in cell wall biosynthesis
MRAAILVGEAADSRWDARVAAGEAPRRDYLELARLLDADIIDASLVGRGRSPFATGFRLAWTAYSRRSQYDLIISDSERCGLPLALLLRGRDRPRHVMIAHRPATRAKLLLGKSLGLYRNVDRTLCYTTQRERLLAAGIEPWRAVLLPHGLPDARFWRPLDRPVEPLVVSAGREYRDYATLIEAARGLPARVEIAAASPWSRRTPTESALRANVRFTSCSYSELRVLYAKAAVVVVPVEETDFQAGTLVITEAMAMAKPVIVSATNGQRDFIDHGVNGLLVPTGDAGALRQAIDGLLDSPVEAARLGQAARAEVERRLSLERFLVGMAELTSELMDVEVEPRVLASA